MDTQLENIVVLVESVSVGGFFDENAIGSGGWHRAWVNLNVQVLDGTEHRRNIRSITHLAGFSRDEGENYADDHPPDDPDFDKQRRHRQFLMEVSVGHQLAVAFRKQPEYKKALRDTIVENRHYSAAAVYPWCDPTELAGTEIESIVNKTTNTVLTELSHGPHFRSYSEVH